MSTVSVAVVGDLHVGGLSALAHPEEMLLQNGAYVTPTKAQKWLWLQWLHFWGEVRRRKADKLIAVVNGEFVDGNTARALGRWSLNTQDQRWCAKATMLAAKEVAGWDHLLVVRGSEFHSGKQGQDDESLARALKAERDPRTMQHSKWIWDVDINGVRINIKHVGWGSFRPWTRGGEVNRMAAAVKSDFFGQPELCPHLVVRSHHHFWADSADTHEPVRVINVGAWKLTDAFLTNCDGVGGMPAVGGMLIQCHGPGEYEVWKHKARPERRKEDLWTLPNLT